MVEQATYRPVTLGGMILDARKKARSCTAQADAFSGKLTEGQTAMADQVGLSGEARSKIGAARKVNDYLGVFGAFLKLLNAAKYGVRPVQYGLEQNLNHSGKRLYDRTI